MGVKVRVEDGKVWIRVDHRGQRRSKLVGTNTPAVRSEAQKAAAIIAGKLAAGDLSALSPAPVESGPKSSPLFRAVATEWLEWHQRNFPRRPSTQENYQSVIDARLIPWFGDRRISSIDRAAVQEFIAAARTTPDPRTGKVVAYTTLVSHYLPCFAKVLDYAVERGHLAANPFRVGAKMFEKSDADREAAPRPDPFTPKELEAIIGAADQVSAEFGLLVRTWSQCGARSGEVRALQVRDLDLRAGTVRIEKTLCEDGGGKIRLGPVKNPQRGKRTASLLHAVATDRKPEAVLARLAAHCQDKAPDAHIFEKPSGGPVTNGSLKERWARALDLAGVRYREPEQIRHTFCSTMLSRGEVLLKVARQTGHTPAVLLQHYAEFIEEAEAPAAPVRKAAASGRRSVA